MAPRGALLGLLKKDVDRGRDKEGDPIMEVVLKLWHEDDMVKEVVLLTVI
jgi:hypothetical protein